MARYEVNQEVRVKLGRFKGKTGQVVSQDDAAYTVTLYIWGIGEMTLRQNEVATICIG